MMKTIAIDWSGARVRAAKTIWLAEAVDGGIVRLENGRSREQVAEFLVAEAKRDPRMVVGFDFAFSLPAWFLEERGLESARKLWALADQEAEDWLARCESPFWGRPGKRRLDLGPARAHFRHTDTSMPSVGGIRPKSVFQIGGAGAVGTGSLRGMPILHRLSEAGFSVWPFDPTGWPLIVEIYPRVLTGAVNKSNSAARAAHLSARQGTLVDDLREHGEQRVLVAINFSAERKTLDLSDIGDKAEVLCSTHPDLTGHLDLERLILRPSEGILLSLGLEA